MRPFVRFNAQISAIINYKTERQQMWHEGGMFAYCMLTISLKVLLFDILGAIGNYKAF